MGRGALATSRKTIHRSCGHATANQGGDATIHVRDGPLGSALDPARRDLYVANTGQDTQKFTVSVVDVTTWKVTSTIPFENNHHRLWQ